VLAFVCASDPLANKLKHELKITALRRNESLFGGAEMIHKNPLLSSQSSLRPVYCYHQTPFTIIFIYLSCLFSVILKLLLLLTLYIICFNGHQINARHNLHSRSQSVLGIKTPCSRALNGPNSPRAGARQVTSMRIVIVKIAGAVGIGIVRTVAPSVNKF